MRRKTNLPFLSAVLVLMSVATTAAQDQPAIEGRGQGLLSMRSDGPGTARIRKHLPSAPLGSAIRSRT
jgi:hypothetical protein